MLSTSTKRAYSTTAGNGSSSSSAAAVELDIPTQLRFLNSPESEISASIRRVNAGFFKLFSKSKVPVAAKVHILFRGQTIDGEVLYCRPERDGYSIGMNISGLRTVRRELRLPVDFPALLRMPESEAPVKIRIVDMSTSGLGLALPIEIQAGTGVAVEFSRGTVFGEIRHCVALSGYFRAGLAAEEFIPLENSTNPDQPSPDGPPGHTAQGLFGRVKETVLQGLKLEKTA
jgi:hypothetical protein